jgi:hypothetical protein
MKKSLKAVKASAAVVGTGLDLPSITIYRRGPVGKGKAPAKKKKRGAAVDYSTHSSSAAVMAEELEGALERSAVALTAAAAAAGAPGEAKAEEEDDNAIRAVVITREQLLASPNKRGDWPTVDELAAALEAHMAGLEGAANRNELYLSWLLREKCGIENFQLIFTPPYYPKCQPIEEVWGDLKGWVAREWKDGRTVAQTREQLLVALYGGRSVMQHDRVGRQPYTGDTTSRFIESAHKFLNSQLELLGPKFEATFALEGVLGKTLMAEEHGPFIIDLGDEDSDDSSDEEEEAQDPLGDFFDALEEELAV